VIAWLGMYDPAPLRAANDRLWGLIRAALGHGPDRLDRARDPWEAWQSPRLLLAQTCGMPYRTRLHGHVTLVGTPDYGLPDCPPGHYQTVLVARRDDPRDLDALAAGTLAYNEALSQSGWAAPVAHLAGLGLAPRHLLRTGAHAASVRAVADGRADLAGIDAVTWALLGDHDPNVARLRVVARTAPTPGLPLITAAGHDPAPIAAAVTQAIASLDPADRRALYLRALVTIPAAAYLAVPTPLPPPGAD
jgi:ABC-type phosphate/phosphonate transport system substrate-binding protein